MAVKSYQSLREFYPAYLREHQDPRCRDCHFIGSTVSLVCVSMMFLTANLSWLFAALLGGYACAWFGHYVFEKNHPATFKYPAYSFLADWLMYRDMWLNRL